MRKLFTFIAVICLALNASAQYQVANSNFEEWETATSYNGKTGPEPKHWNSFITATGSFKSTIVTNAQLEASTNVRQNATGSSALIKARSVVFAIAQGNMTTGRINGGSMSADDANGNFNFTDVENDDFKMPFTGRPDAMKVWINNYTSSGSGKIAVYLHGNGYYQDPNNGNTSSLTELTAFATGTPKTSSSKTYSQGNWQQIQVSFEYRDEIYRPSYALVSFATNSTPGGGSSNDWMYIDDMEMVYYSELASATYNGNVITFNGTSAIVNEEYDANKLNISSNGHGATVETSMDEATQLLTVTIKGDNISEDATNFHTYTIQFKKPYAKGDVNKDGSVTIADVTALVNIILGKGGDDDMADVNGDEGITIADVTALVNIILGKN